MTEDWQRPAAGDGQAALVTDAPSRAAQPSLAAQPSEAVEEPQPDDAAPEEAVVVKRGSRPSALLVLASLILLVVIVQAVMTWISLGVVKEVRDQSATANGLQHCLIQAQLSAANATDNGAAYRTAVQACLNK